MDNLLEELGTCGLGLGFIARALETPESPAVLDSRGSAHSYGELALRALALARVMERTFAKPAEEPRVGIILPPSVAGALANLALGMTRRASVNLNALAGPVSLRAQMAQAGLAHVITSKQIFGALGGTAVFEERAVFIEDLLTSVGAPDLDSARRVIRSSPSEVRGLADASVDRTQAATVLFSSGSTARAKAIQLSHANVLFNARAVAEAFEFGPADRLFGLLPFFHSFGYTVTLWTPLVAGGSVLFHDNPLDARAVGELAREHRPTVLLATPALYQAWMRRVEREQFASVRAAVVGAQRLPETLGTAWFERYGTALYEGYGCTELSPVVCANLPDRDGFARRRAGSVGRALHGVEVEVRDPLTGQALPAGVEGDLWVRGDGVMLGYLDDPEATKSALVEGWYDTQDVGRRDSDGFVTITDRRSRFSKIGGEMISHGAVEWALGKAAAALDSSAVTVGLAVTAIADEQRGERLVLVHTQMSFSVDALLERARKDGLANMFTPRSCDCFEVEALPQLATGKLDLVGLKRLAQARCAGISTS